MIDQAYHYPEPSLVGRFYTAVLKGGLALLAISIITGCHYDDQQPDLAENPKEIPVTPEQNPGYQIINSSLSTAVNSDTSSSVNYLATEQSITQPKIATSGRFLLQSNPLSVAKD